MSALRSSHAVAEPLRPSTRQSSPRLSSPQQQSTQLPGSHQPGTQQPDNRQPDAWQADTQQPDAWQADTQQPGSRQPDIRQQVTTRQPSSRQSVSQQSLAAQIRRQRIRPVPQMGKSRPLFHWDATQHLPPESLDEHRGRFPQFQGLPPHITELPDAGTWAANLAIGIIEVMLHQRPLAQLERWVVPGLFDAFAQAHQLLKVTGARRPPIKVATYRACAISERIAETCIILDLNGLRRTISIRLEGHRGRWIATALQIL